MTSASISNNPTKARIELLRDYQVNPSMEVDSTGAVDERFNEINARITQANAKIDLLGQRHEVQDEKLTEIANERTQIARDIQRSVKIIDSKTKQLYCLLALIIIGLCITTGVLIYKFG